MKISSLQNSTVKRAVKLRSRAERDRAGVLLIEGFRALGRALDASWRIDQVLACPDLFREERGEDLIDRCRAARIPITEFAAPPFRKMAYRDKPEGLIALGAQAGLALDELPLGENPLLLVAEGIEKPGNIGSMLRVADGVGADGLILVDGCTDINNPNVVRSSVGAIFSLPIAESSSQVLFEWLRSRGISTLAATPAVENLYTQIDLAAPQALLVGAEGPGLSRFWIEHADLQARIPMLGKVDSLNVSSSAAILLYEARRQRETACF